MTSAPPDTQLTADSGQQTGCYVYGILPGDAELTEEVYGVGDREVRLVRSGELAALVSEVDLAEPLGTPRDFQAHKEVLDSIITGAPVLPLRFGAVLTGEDAVVQEVLDPHHDEFAKALEDLEGQLQYVVKGRYVERAMLQEVLSGRLRGRRAAGTDTRQGSRRHPRGEDPARRDHQQRGRGDARRRHRLAAVPLGGPLHRQLRPGPDARARTPSTSRSSWRSTKPMRLNRPSMIWRPTGKGGSMCACSARWLPTTSSAPASRARS